MMLGSRDQGLKGSRRSPLRACVPVCLRAFTLVEVLIVIVVIGLLIAAIGLVGVKVIHHQKVNFTQSIMRNVRLAIDQFANDNPLGAIYDRKTNISLGIRPTFGPYPPYQLAARGGTCVSGVLEPGGSLPGDYALANRFHRDFGNRVGSVQNFVSWGTVDPPAADLDIRALYTYLRVYANSVLTQVPASALKPLSATPEYVNPAGTGASAGVAGAVDVLGIHDAWGVPLDYFLYVKLEWGITGWTVTQRVPVLRSLGVSKDVYDVARPAGTLSDYKQDWIFSDPFPSPAANQANAAFWQTGTLNTNAGTENGWARAVGAGDLSVGGDRESAFGFVP